MKTATPQIGQGIYSVADMAAIFRLPKHRVRYLFNDLIRDKFEKAASHKFYFGENRKFVNFKALIHLYFFFELKKRGISYSKILTTYKELVEILDTPYPFVKAIIGSEGHNITAMIDETIISGNRQIYIKEIIEPLIQKIEFENNEISKFFPLGKNNSVVVNPTVQFGSPTINGTRINIAVISELHESGESIEMISKMYNLSSKQVKDAIEFSIAA